jgi:hypothetical protein
MSIASPLLRSFTVISLPASGHASAQRFQLTTVVCSVERTMSPVD